MEHADCKNFVNILKHELVAALGCTEPIAIAYAAAKARQVLGEHPTKVHIKCSGNIIKNVKGVTVPNSGGQKGIEIAAVLGIVGGDADRALEVISDVTEAQQKETRALVEAGYCECELAEGVANLYIEVRLTGEVHRAKVIIADGHTHIIHIEKDGEVLFSDETGASNAGEDEAFDKSKLSVAAIIDFANSVDLESVSEILDRQIEFNTAISDEGMRHPWGANVGKTYAAIWDDDVKTRAVARAAAGSDARMSGCSLPVVINSGSGNQGITVSMPVIEYVQSNGLSREQLYRGLLVSNLVSIHIKRYIGKLSAFCGAVSAACGAGAAVTYLCGGDVEHIGMTIINTLGNVGGIVCDGAKPSCAAKIASSVNAAIMAHHMSMSDNVFRSGEGFIESDIEKTIQNMGYIGRVGMRQTDVEILNLMIDKADVTSN